MYLHTRKRALVNRKSRALPCFFVLAKRTNIGFGEIDFEEKFVFEAKRVFYTRKRTKANKNGARKLAPFCFYQKLSAKT